MVRFSLVKSNHTKTKHLAEFNSSTLKSKFVSLSKKLSSVVSLSIVLGVASGQTFYVARVLFGCLPMYLALIFWFCRQINILSIGLFLVLILLVKCIQVYKFHLMARLNDSFWLVFLTIWILFFTILLVLIKFMFGLYKTTTMKVMTCGGFDVVDNVPGLPWYDVIG